MTDLLAALRQDTSHLLRQRPRKTPECDPSLWLAFSIFWEAEHPPIHEEQLWIAVDSLGQFSPRSRANMPDVLRGRASGETLQQLAQRFGVGTERVRQQESKALRILRSRVRRFAPSPAVIAPKEER